MRVFLDVLNVVWYGMVWYDYGNRRNGRWRSLRYKLSRLGTFACSVLFVCLFDSFSGIEHMYCLFNMGIERYCY